MTLGQTDRFRDRQTNRRREANPLTRSYDSRGPDVRIRGAALHVAERYLQLARDANTTSNPVAAENYLQHDSDDFDGLPDRFASPGRQARPSATKPMVLPRLLRNHTRNDSAGLGVKS